jgi:hypothetical protein
MLLALFAAAAARADYASDVLAKGPLGYWRFNETAPSPALDTVTNSSPLGSIANGYVVENGTNLLKGQPGIVGNCLLFYNAGNTDVGNCLAKVDVPFNVALNPPPPFSVEFWAKPNSLGGDSTGDSPVSNFNPNWYNGGNRTGWLFYLNNTGRWEFRLGLTAGYAGKATGTGGNAKVGVWQHIVATFDGTNATLYADGVVIAKVDTSTAPGLANWVPNPISFLRMGGTSLVGNNNTEPYNANIGTGSNSGNRGWDGSLDELAIYPTLLSAAKVAAHHDAASTNNAGYSAQILADGPVAYWGMEDALVTAPDPSTFPTGTNSGTLGSAADGVLQWGALAGQSGSGYAGFGADNHAALFDGDNGYFQVNDAPELHSLTNKITLMAWVKPGVKDYYRYIIGHGFDVNTGNETFLRISRGFDPSGAGVDGHTFYEVGVTDGANYYDAASIDMPSGDIGNWVFLAGTYDGANWNLYRNGVLAASFPSSNPPLDVTNRWTIGSRSDPTTQPGTPNPAPGNGCYFGGSIDEPAIFNTALSPTDITSLYNSAQVPPVITEAPQNPGTVFSGNSVSFSVFAEGSPTLSYMWSSNGVSTGVTTTNYSANNLVAGNTTIAVVVTNVYGAITSSVSFDVITAAPLITQQPQSATRFTGRSVTFSVVAGGTLPLGYQWKFNGNPVSGATASSYTFTANQATAGSYTVSLSNAGGNLDSTPAILVALPIPTGYPGVVIGDSPVSYWRLDEGSGTVAHDYLSGNDGTYFNVTLGQPGYSVLDTDTAVAFSGLNSYVGNINGKAINFTGHTNFSLEAWANGPAGQADQSTIIAKGIGSGGTTRTEQFALDVSSGVYHFFIAGNNNALYEATATDGPNGTWQHVVGVYDDAGGQMSIYVNGQLQGQGGTRASGLNATVSPVSIGSKRTGNDPSYDGTFTGTIDEVAVYSVALNPTQIQNHFQAAYGSTLPPAILFQPQPATNYVGLPASFSVGAFGSFPLTYQWSKDGAPINGATDASYTNTAVALTDAGNYAVMVSNAVGSTNSVAVPLVVLAVPTSPPSISDLVLHLTFDNTLTDATGRGNNGTNMSQTATSTNTSSATFVADGAVGAGLHYSSDMGAYPGPTSTNTSYVTLGVVPDLQFSSNVNFTVAYWIRLPLNYILGDLPFFTDTAGSTFGLGYVFAPTYGSGATVANNGTTSGGWAMSVFDVNANGIGVYGDVGSINDGAWHHLVHVMDRQAGMVTYLDGIPAHYARQTGSTIAPPNADMDATPPHPATIGQDPTGHYGETGSADIDDLGVWRRTLTPLEAASIYVAGLNKISFGGSGPVNTAPTITAGRSGSNLIISWAPAGGTLQSAPVLLPGGSSWTTVGTTNPATVLIGSSNAFFRVTVP